MNSAHIETLHCYLAIIFIFKLTHTINLCIPCGRIVSIICLCWCDASKCILVNSRKDSSFFLISWFSYTTNNDHSHDSISTTLIVRPQKKITEDFTVRSFLLPPKNANLFTITDNIRTGLFIFIYWKGFSLF